MRHLLLIILLALVFYGCKKEDTVLPSVDTVSPLAMKHFSYGDVIKVIGDASDDVQLKKITIDFVGKDDLISSGIKRDILVDAQIYRYEENFELNEVHMPSGNYYIKVTATDKSGNAKSSYTEFTYTELPRTLDNIYVTTKTGSNGYDLYEIGSGSPSFVQTFDGDFQDMIANSHRQQLIFSGGSAGNIISYDPIYLDYLWQHSPKPTSQPYYNQLYLSPSLYNPIVTTGNSSCITYDAKGQVQQTITFPPNTYAEEVIEIDDYLIIEEKSLTDRHIAVYFKSTGQKKHEYLVTADIVKFLFKESGELFVLTSENGNSNMYIYYPDDNSTFEPHNIDPGTIYDACRINSNEIIIAHATGLLRYTYLNNSLVNISSDVCNQLAYDDLNLLVVGNVGAQLNFYTNLGSPAGSISHTASIDKFVLFYNK